LPSLPHAVVGPHWPLGAVSPAVMGAHVPSALPVSAMVHAWQVPVHAVVQQIWLPLGPTQWPSMHVEPCVHVMPRGRSWQVGPGQ
jgi:hypothetical protein